MTNRDMCVSVIDSMEEWQLQSVLHMLQSMKDTMDALETGTVETMSILSNPELTEKLLEGKKTPLSECVPESDIHW